MSKIACHGPRDCAPPVGDFSHAAKPKEQVGLNSLEFFTRFA
jgi:hypothetical protein